MKAIQKSPSKKSPAQKFGFFRSMFADENGNVSSKRVLGSFLIFSATTMCIVSGLGIYSADPILIWEQLTAGGLLLGSTAFTNRLAIKNKNFELEAEATNETDDPPTAAQAA